MRTCKCALCKQEFLKSELISYASPNCKTSYNYCIKCLEIKQKKDEFVREVCRIFGLKGPGPRIWKDRQRLIEKYGYTDDIIVRTLKYLYDIKKTKKLSESLYLITPQTVNEMLNYEREQQAQANMIAAAAAFKDYKYKLVKPQEVSGTKKKLIDVDQILEE